MTIECCADVIAFHQGKLVLIERLTTPRGLALPGGRLKEGESLEQCAVREFKEETGLTLSIDGQFRTYSNPGRDPRGQKVSTVFFGIAHGLPKHERNKTKVVLCTIARLDKYLQEFVFDHCTIIQDFVRSNERCIQRKPIAEQRSAIRE
ncbi:MAG: NUDIX hydrolase [archaeon]